MSSVLEIEVAIERLSPAEQESLRDWLLKRTPSSVTNQPKNGAELAAAWPQQFHLTPDEANDLARDLEIDRHRSAAFMPLQRAPVHAAPNPQETLPVFGR